MHQPPGTIDISRAAPAVPTQLRIGLDASAWHGLPLVVDREQAGAQAFAALGCRGFSYAFSTAPRFRIAFPQRVNLRFALHLPASAGHPPAVARALRRDRCRHVISAGGRCGGFALGTARREAQGDAWYIYALQSDVALFGRPVLRDYLRGWRKVLMACVLNTARAAAVQAVYLTPTDAVYDTARMNRAFPMTRVPDLWRQIYDRTAQEFGMAPVEIDTAINIQSTPHRRPYACRRFFRLDLSAGSSAPR
ncbi:MAG: hypothetical protein ABI629_16615 [bacterium]